MYTLPEVLQFLTVHILYFKFYQRKLENTVAYRIQNISHFLLHTLVLIEL